MTFGLAERTTLCQGITDWDVKQSEPDTGTGELAVFGLGVLLRTSIRCAFPGGELTVDVPGHAPPWLAPTAQALVELLALPPNWDSDGAREIKPGYVEAALKLLWQIMCNETPPPSVVPTNRGGVQVEWHTRGVDLEIEVLSPQLVVVCFEDAQTGEDWELEITTDMSPLVKCIGRIS